MSQITKKIFYWGSPGSPFVHEQVAVGKKLGFSVHWYFHREPKQLGAVTYSLPKFVSNSLFFRSFYEPLFIGNLLRRIKPDLIHIFYTSKGFSTFPLLQYHPLIVSVMGSDVSPGLGYRWPYRLFIQRLLNGADKILVKSSFMEQSLASIGNYEDRIVRMPWGVDLDVFNKQQATNKIRDALGVPSNGTVFFEPRNATKLYNKHITLRSFHAFLLQSGRKDDVLILSEQAGDPGYTEKLHRYVQGAEIESNVRFVGSIPFELVPNFYALADVVISVPSSDGLPQSLYEAMASGCALIISDLAQYSELSKAGMIAEKVPVGKTDSLTQAMLRLTDNKQLLDQASFANRKLAERMLDLKMNQEKLASLYKELISGTHQEH